MTTDQETSGRNSDGTFKLGFSGNPGGRPKNSLKDYLKRKFSNMSDEEKEKWLKENRVSGEVQFKMAEGNPKQGIGGEDDEGNPIPVLVKFIDGKDGGITQKRR